MSDILKLADLSAPPGVLHAGWNFVIARPGEEAEVRCRVCGEVMAVDKLCIEVAAGAPGLAAGTLWFMSRGLPTPGDISAALSLHPGAYTLSLGHIEDLTLGCIVCRKPSTRQAL